MTTLRGSTILLTGASRGLGTVIAVRLAAEGANLVLAARDVPQLEQCRATCEAQGVTVLTVPTDVSLSGDRERLVAQAGPVDVLVNNAGVEITEALRSQSVEEIETQIATNLTAPIALTRLVLPGMLGRRRGVIVNISSMSGKGATPFNSVYAATKFGLNGFTASLRLELEGSGVHAGTVCPSFVAGKGMWADRGLPAPRLMREVSPERVAAAVLEVIRGAAEVLVTPAPIRPMLALRELFPRLEGAVLRRLGVMDVLKRRARRDGSSLDRKE
ncbi:MAG TPA: SDR family NAD(P)-dependent oxidoreductase [Vicinamibacterales bacterium]|nr:SDR family NAD(P)-dependent oxidoreductase [Vicinamibacterales bacterium]